MKFGKTVMAMITMAIGATAFAPLSAQAAPRNYRHHRGHQVCHFDRHHHRLCHWER